MDNNNIYNVNDSDQKLDENITNCNDINEMTTNLIQNLPNRVDHQNILFFQI